MTINIATTPNHLRVHGDVTVSSWFGGLRSCTHTPHHDVIRCEFQGRVCLELTPDTATALVRRLQEALVFAPPANLGGSVWGFDE